MDASFSVLLCIHLFSTTHQIPFEIHVLKFDLIWIGLDWIVGVFSTIHHPSIVRLSGVWLFENEFRIKLYNSRCLYLFINYLLRVCLGK